VRALEIVALGNFLACLVDGIVDLLHVDFGNNIKTRHVLSLLAENSWMINGLYHSPDGRKRN
jgi:hypothetical protein